MLIDFFHSLEGTIWVLSPPEGSRINFDQLREITQPNDQQQQSASVGKLSKSALKKANKFEQTFTELPLEQQEQFFVCHHCDIIGEQFWQWYGHLLQL